MLRSATVRIVDFCARHAWLVFIAGVLLALATTAYDVTRFSITTDVESLISRDVPWHRRQLVFFETFPQYGTLAVVRAPTPEFAEQATNALAQQLVKNQDLFRAVTQPDSGEFFERNGLLFQPLPDVEKSTAGLVQAQPLIRVLAGDPSLRGVMRTLSLVASGVQSEQVGLDQLVWPLTLAGNTLADVLSDRPAMFSWQGLVQGRPASNAQLRHFLEIQPVLDFSALEPGRKSTNAIYRAAIDLNLTEKFNARVDVTGRVPMDDDQFAAIRKSALRDTLIAIGGVLVLLWLALHSWRLVAAVFFSLMVGLAATAALGIAMVGAFNLISVAFFMLFVGLGVDFAIQLSVRYRSERHDHPDLHEALRSSARKAGVPLGLAAAATAAAFFSFVPTSYTGLSELGQIAGFGMLIAFLCSITLVPALLTLLRTPGEPRSVGFAKLAPLDGFLQRHRIAIVAGTMIVVLLGAPLLLRVPFDFNPVNLNNPNTPSVATYRELRQEPEAGLNNAAVAASSLDQADAIAQRLTALPEVLRTLTLSNFIPDEQDRKRAVIRHAADVLKPVLDAKDKQPAPSDQDVVAAIEAAAERLSTATGDSKGPGADAARRLSDLLGKLAQSDPAMRSKAEAAVVPSLVYNLARLRNSLEPQTITAATLPAQLVRDWQSPDGQARVEIVPRGDPNDTNGLHRFAVAVLAAEPAATGAAISYYEAGRTVLNAFFSAAGIALGVIALLLWLALRRITDVLLTLVPLLLAAAVTLEICVLTGLALNFANVIALPLLLGVGVAFKIYYIMAWRAGKTGLLQSTLTRAVIFSALTNAAAFGSMWASDYPGMSSMGKLMALALLCTMFAAVLFQPVLMGPPRKIEPPEPF
jgi:hopanoid biosynthesis associated RND transporter like protein HpnN